MTVDNTSVRCQACGAPDYYGLAVPSSSHSRYSHHTAAAMGDASWNDGRLLSDPAAYTALLEDVQARADRALKHSSAATVRSYHAM